MKQLKKVLLWIVSIVAVLAVVLVRKRKQTQADK